MQGMAFRLLALCPASSELSKESGSRKRQGWPSKGCSKDGRRRPKPGRGSQISRRAALRCHKCKGRQQIRVLNLCLLPSAERATPEHCPAVDLTVTAHPAWAALFTRNKFALG